MKLIKNKILNEVKYNVWDKAGFKIETNIWNKIRISVAHRIRYNIKKDPSLLP